MERVPREEIERRTSALREQLTVRELDGALIFQNVDLFYFTGTVQGFALFIPRDGEPILMVQRSLARAKEESPLGSIVPARGREEMAELLRGAGHPLRSVGLEMDVLPVSLYLTYTKSFPDCRFEDLSREVRTVRMLKSPYEVSQIRRACAILDGGFEEIRDAIRPGVTEVEIDGRLALIARREGHMGLLRMRGWNQEMIHAHVLSGESGAVPSYLNSPHGGTGTTPAIAQGAGFRRISRNEPIGVDFGVGVNGYVGDEFRTFVVGELPPLLGRAHACAVEIHELLVGTARPGMPCTALYDLACGMAEKADLRENFMGHGETQARFLGHGIGLEIDELPVIAPNFRQPLQEGMVMALEPKFVFPGIGVVCVEDDYLVTASGLERLTKTPQTIMKIPG
jgi:Xaa-Pro dipeptidase